MRTRPLALTLALAAVATVLASSSSASADELPSASTATAPPPADAPAKTERRWYGYQTLAADGASLGLGLLSGVTDSRIARDGIGGAALVGYAAAPAAIHFAHGHVGRGVGSVALRVGTPVVGAFVGAVVGTVVGSSRASDDAAGVLEATIVAPVQGMVYGFMAGVVTASAIDAALLSWEDAPRRTAPEPSTRAASVSLAPSLGPTRGGFAAGVSGTF